MNDATGTLMSCAYKNVDCHVGLIVGKNSFLKVFLIEKKYCLWFCVGIPHGLSLCFFLPDLLVR